MTEPTPAAPGARPGPRGVLSPPPRPGVAEAFRVRPDRRGDRVGVRTASPLISGLAGRGPAATADALREQARRTGTPLVEADAQDGTILTFVCDAADAETVALVLNRAIDGRILAESTFDRLPGTGLWHLSLRVGPTWRGSYAIAVVPRGALDDPPARDDAPEHDGPAGQTGSADDAEAARARDEAAATTNARTLEGYERRRREHARGGAPVADHPAIDRWFDVQRHAAADPWAREQLNARVSVASAPQAPRSAVRSEAAGAVAGSRAGELHDLRHRARGHEDRLAVHVPAVEPPDGGWGVLVLLDGQDWIDAGVARLLDALAASGRVRPTITVLVGAVDDPWRVSDLMCDPDFVAYLENDALPRVAARWPLSPDPAHTAIAGQSLGGLTAVYAQCVAPGRFGASISQSGAFWWPSHDPDAAHAEWLTRAIVRDDVTLDRVWLEAGLKESGQARANRRLVAALEGRTRRLDYREFDGGHDRACWRAGLTDAILAVLGDEAVPDRTPRRPR